MFAKFIDFLDAEINTLKKQGLYKAERIIASPQQAEIKLNNTSEHIINLCANNYLGLANHPILIKEGQKALAQYGYGMASVRFICGTQIIHKQLENELANFLNKEDVILYSSCFDANTGLFETLLGKEDAIISDELNHASLIDGIRLCKAMRFKYANNNMQALKEQLIAAKDARFKFIVTDGVFSMDGIIANLPEICTLAEQHEALVMVDDSHAVGFLGEYGGGTPQYHNVEKNVHIVTGTLGKALGGASGGYTSSSKIIIDYLRQRSRPYLFSNTLAPVIVATSLAAISLLKENTHLLQKLKTNSEYFRKGLEKLGFKLIPGEHPIIPVMIGNEVLASKMAEKLMSEGIYVVSFSFPVVPHGKARIRTQMSSAHDITHLNKALAAFAKVGKELNII